MSRDKSEFKMPPKWDRKLSSEDAPHSSQDAQAAMLVREIADQVCARIMAERDRIEAYDQRPNKTSSPECRNVRMPYVAQGLLEDVIQDLQARV